MSENTTSVGGMPMAMDERTAAKRRRMLACAYSKIRQRLSSLFPPHQGAYLSVVMSEIWATIETELIPIVDWGRATGQRGYSAGSGPLTP